MKPIPIPRSYPSAGHPWADFLHHRMRALAWLRSEGRSAEQMVAATTTDPVQVRLLLATFDDMASRGEVAEHVPTTAPKAKKARRS